MQEIKIDLKDNSYSVFIGSLGKLSFDSKVAILSNQKVAGLHLKTLLERINAPQISVITVPDGEAYKNMQTIEQILEQMFVARLDRKSTLIALGGGVVTDMGGFAASIYERGIDFINIPTTLLAAIDASVGGKTGVNNAFGKNLIGSFYQPRAVHCDSSFLATLAPREISAGIAEAIKMAVMFDEGFFTYLASYDLSGDLTAFYDEIIAKCVRLKSSVVAKDEKENGIRAVLNYGHTFAHVIEKQSGYGAYLHGEAVAIGMVMANELALKLNLLNADDASKIKECLKRFALPLNYAISDINAFYDAFYLDKKSANNKIKFILPNGSIGSHSLRDDIDKNVVLSVLEGFKA